MPDIERINSIYDMQAIGIEHEKLAEYVSQDTQAIVALYSNIEKFQGKSNVSSIAKNWNDVTNSMVGAAGASDQLVQMQQKLNDVISKNSQLEKQLQDVIAKGTTVRKSRNDMTDQELKSSLDSIQATKDRVKNILAESDAYKQLENAASSATKAAKSLSVKANMPGATPEDIAAAKEATIAAKGLNDQLKAVDNSLGLDSRNVGRYKESLIELEKQLAAIRQSIGKMAGLGDTMGLQEQKKRAQDLSEEIVSMRQSMQSENGGATVRMPDTKALNTLKTQLNTVNSEMVKFVALGEEDSETYQQLQKEAEALNIVIGQQSKGFASTTMQVRSAERALQTLRVAGLEGSEGFEALRNSTIKAAQAQKEFQRQEKLLESEAPVLGAITLAAKGLAGMYAIGAGASALFADGNEKVEKELSKLVAIMTILQGLHEAYELIQQSGAARAAIRTSLDKIANKVLGENADATMRVATANAEAAAAAEALTTATAEEIPAMEAAAAAAAETAVATEAAAAANAEAATAFLATGIGFAIAAVAVAVIYLIAKLKEWTAESELTVKQQKELNDTLKEEVEILKEINELYEKRPDISDSIKDLKNQLDYETKIGDNQYKILAVKDLIAKKNKDIAKYETANVIADAEQQYNGANGTIKYTGTDALKKAQQEAFEKQTQSAYQLQAFQNQLSLEQSKPNTERREGKIDETKELLDRAKSLNDFNKARYQFFKDASDKIDEADKEYNDLQTERLKMNEDDRRKILLEFTKMEVDLITSKNALILSDDRSMLDERLKAMRSDTAEQRKLIEADRVNVTSNRGSTPAEVLIANKKAADDNLKLTAESADKERKLKYHYYVLDRDAQIEIFNDENTDRKNQAQSILDDVKSNFDQRTNAQSKLYEAQRQMLGSQFLKDLDQEGLTNEQKLALSKKYETDLIKLNIDYGKILEDEQKADHEKQLKAVDEFYDKLKDKQIEAQAQSRIGLNEKFTSGKIGTGTYDARKEQQDFENKKSDAQNNVTEKYADVNKYKEGTKDRTDAEAQLAKASMDLSDLIADHEESNIKKVADLQKEAAKDVANTLVSFVDDAYENETKHLERQMTLNERYKNEQIERIHATTIGQQQQAAAVNVIERQAASNQAAIERREREVKIKQARFDRDVAVAQTIEQGAVAAISALKLPPPFGEAEAIAIGLITVAKVSEILARPLPTYGFGTQDHPGGLAVTGDRGKHEMIIEPGKSPYWSPNVPTVMNLAEHTKVITPEQIARMQEGNMYVNHRGILVSGSDNSTRKITDALTVHANRLEKVLSGQKKQVVVRNVIGTNWGHYVETNVFNWKK